MVKLLLMMQAIKLLVKGFERENILKQKYYTHISNHFQTIYILYLFLYFFYS